MGFEVDFCGEGWGWRNSSAREVDIGKKYWGIEERVGLEGGKMKVWSS